MQACSPISVRRSAMQRTSVHAPNAQLGRVGTVVPVFGSSRRIAHSSASTHLRASCTTPLPECSGSTCSRPSRRRAVAVAARSGRVQRGNPEVVDRVIAAAPYILPFLNAFVYARFLYHTQPLIRSCFQPLMPIITPFHSIPFASVIAFFGVYIGVAQNQKLSRFVRFNAIQAILLDILLVLPRLVEVIISPPLMGWGRDLYVNMNSALWVSITCLVVYGICSALLGQYGRIPFISEAADEQIR